MTISIEKIDEILPQTQCQKCTYPDCYSYAKAIKNGEKHNKCITGGQKTVKELSILLKKPEIALDISLGKEKLRTVAKIDETMCIGCEKCLLSCPVDAIVGAKKLMHTVIQTECTGCELCIKPCPMDCISLIDLDIDKQPNNLNNINYRKQKNHYRSRYKYKIYRKANENITNTEIQKIDKKAYIASSLAKFRKKSLTK